MNQKIKFVFFGTGEFAVKVIDFLYHNDFRPSLIITTPDKPQGRTLQPKPTPMKHWAQTRNKVIIQPETLIDVRELIVSYFDLFIVCDYGKIIPRHVLNIPKYGCLNLHPSLLPKFRGPAPIQSFILSGENETGVTIILMGEEVDCGPIIASEKLKVKSEKLYYKELEEKLAELGGELLIKIIPDWMDEKMNPQEQDHDRATYTKKIIKKDGFINWCESAEIIERKIRAFTPWPGAYFFVDKNGKKFRIIITEAELKNSKLIIKKIKPEGKNEMTLEDFLRGNPELGNQIKKLSKDI